MVDVLEIMYNHPWWTTLWLGIVMLMVIGFAEGISKRNKKQD